MNEFHLIATYKKMRRPAFGNIRVVKVIDVRKPLMDKNMPQAVRDLIDIKVSDHMECGLSLGTVSCLSLSR